MDPFVKTRWNADGLVEITMDAGTAHHLLRDLGATSGVLTLKLYESLAHTLNAEQKGMKP